MKTVSIKIGQLALMRDRLLAESFSGNRSTLFSELSLLVEALMNKDTSEIVTPDEEDTFKWGVSFAQDCLSSLLDSADDADHSLLMSLLDSIGCQWISNYDDFAILFLDGDYSISHYGSKNLRIQLNSVETLLGVHISKIPVFVHIPDRLRTDLFMGIILLHEFGHFYDFAKGITNGAWIEFQKNASLNGDLVHLIQTYFPDCIKPVNTSTETHIKITNGATTYDLEINRIGAYLSEYIADLFAAQYVGDSCCRPWDYIPHDDTGGNLHPSDVERKTLINDYLSNNSSNVLLNSIKKAFLAYGPFIEASLDSHTDESFLSGDTVSFATVNDMLRSFKTAWDLHSLGRVKMEEKQPTLKGSLSDAGFYYRINKTLFSSIHSFLRQGGDSKGD